MAEEQKSADPRINDTEIIIQESRERIRQALESEAIKLKEKADRDSSQIIAQAKKDADTLMAQARQAAKADSERIAAKAKEEAEQIIKESREAAAKVKQDSVRAINEARGKVTQIIAEAIESGTKQAQIEFARVASEAKNKASELLIQVTQGIDQIIGEAEKNKKTEPGTPSSAVAETNRQAPEDKPNKEAEVNPQPAAAEPVKQVTGAAVMPADSANENPKADAPKSETPPEDKMAVPVADKRMGSIRVKEDSRLFKGRVKLEIVSPFNQGHQGGVQEWLGPVRGLRVVSTGGHSGVNRWITNQVIDLDEPLPLVDILRSVPSIKDISSHKENITITMR